MGRLDRCLALAATLHDGLPEVTSQRLEAAADQARICTLQEVRDAFCDAVDTMHSMSAELRVSAINAMLQDMDFAIARGADLAFQDC